MQNQIKSPPKAKKIPQILTKHGDTRVDNYYWLNQRENPEVLEYIKQENEYLENVLSPVKDLRKRLFEEMKSRIKEDDESVPYRFNGYWYFTRYVKGGEYPIYLRRKDAEIAKEELMLDENELAKGKSFYQVGGIAVSINNQLMAYSEDVVGRRIYTIKFKNLVTGEILPDVIENTTGQVVWANDNQTIFYVRKDDALRPFKIFKHVLGTTSDKDECVFHEKDETFSCFLSKTKSQKYLIIGSTSTLSDEYRILSAEHPNGEWKIFQKRKRGLEYSIDHFGDTFYIRTNADKATNFKIMVTSENKTEKKFWKDFLPHRKESLVEDFEIFQKAVIVEERINGLVQFKVIPVDGKPAYYIKFDEQVFAVSSSVNLDAETPWFRFTYTSLTTPWSTIEYNLETGEKRILKEQEVLGGFDKRNYVTKRLWAPARDGKKVPISLVYHKDYPPTENRPLLLYGYGSYGASMDVYFSSSRLSLLNRGFSFAIAHIRGGEDLGREWYEDGKLLKKKNTFYDFIDCAKYLIEHKFTSSSKLYAMGGSAGGLLIGAVINMEPKLFHGAIAQVPFVDVVTTMLDETIPLTTGEYDEWGNPNDKEYYHYMKSYSPYDNVEAKEYPHLLVTSGLHDSQVQYFEPTKWVAKLREMKTDSNLLLLYTNMEAGHGGASGRFESLKEVAMEYAFLLYLEGILH